MTTNESNKWADPTYHALEAMRELNAAETHLVQYLDKHNEDEMRNLLERIRNFRKGIEKKILGDDNG